MQHSRLISVYIMQASLTTIYSLFLINHTLKPLEIPLLQRAR